MTETEIMSAVRRAEWLRKVGLALALSGVVIGGAVAVQFVPGDPKHFSQAEFLGFGSGAVLLMGLGLGMLRFGRIPKEARTPRIAMLRAEGLQRRRQIAFLIMPVSLGMMLFATTDAASDIARGRAVTHIDLFESGAFIVIALGFAALIAGRGLDRWAKPVLDDELSRELRARALGFGYAVLLTLVAGLFGLALVSRTIAIQLVPTALALGVAAPAIRLFLLERSAGAGGEEP